MVINNPDCDTTTDLQIVKIIYSNYSSVKIK